MENYRPRRSALYVPGSNNRAIDKSRGLEADIVIIDLEDSVSPTEKYEARANAVRQISDGGFGQKEVAVRINGPESQWYDEDIAAVRSLGPSAALLPKVNNSSDVSGCAAALHHSVPVWAMIETAKAMFELSGIAEAASRRGPACLVMGTNDLQKELGVKSIAGRSALNSFLMLTVAAGRAHGVTVLDGVFNQFKDSDGFFEECRAASALGFDGKTLIHPSQVGPCNEAFSPEANEIAWARTVVAAFEDPQNAAAGVINLEGEMVERLHLAQAENTLALAAAAKAHSGSMS